MVQVTDELSTSSLPIQELINIQDLGVKEFAKAMLKGRLFIGTFQEKRLVADLAAYRDVVIVSKEEHFLTRDLESVKKRLQKCNTRWVGITTPDTIGAPAGHALWVELTEEVFGTYWYKIQSVKFRRNEILLKLKTIRPVTIESTEATAAATVKDVGSQNCRESFSQFFDPSGVKDVVSHLFGEITARDVKNGITFVFVLLMTLFGGGVNFLCHASDYLLKLMHEMSKMITALTPIFIALIEAVTKIVGGFYLLIAMMWKSSREPSRIMPPRQAISYERQPRYRF